MIKKRNAAGIQANLSLEAAASSNNSISNNIIINRREDGKEDIVITRDVEIQQEEPDFADVRNVILETYAQILLNQDKALISNLISKKCIIVPLESLEAIIKSILHVADVEIQLNEDINCCAVKSSPIRKIDAIKIITESGEVIMDMKQVYNKEYNTLTNNYHLCMKFCLLN